MTTATKPRKPARSRVFGLPRLLNRLPISDRAIKKIQAANDMHLLRFYFGTADNADVEALYTHLVISWGLAGRMHDAEGIREELWKGIELINRSFRAKTPREMDPQILVAVQERLSTSSITRSMRLIASSMPLERDTNRESCYPKRGRVPKE